MCRSEPAPIHSTGWDKQRSLDEDGVDVRRAETAPPRPARSRSPRAPPRCRRSARTSLPAARAIFAASARRSPGTSASTERPSQSKTSDLTIWPSSQPTACAASFAVGVPSGNSSTRTSRPSSRRNEVTRSTASGQALRRHARKRTRATFRQACAVLTHDERTSRDRSDRGVLPRRQRGHRARRRSASSRTEAEFLCECGDDRCTHRIEVAARGRTRRCASTDAVPRQARARRCPRSRRSIRAPAALRDRGEGRPASPRRIVRRLNPRATPSLIKARRRSPARARPRPARPAARVSSESAISALPPRRRARDGHVRDVHARLAEERADAARSRPARRRSGRRPSAARAPSRARSRARSRASAGSRCR